MYYPLASGAPLYRVTDAGAIWPTPLHGIGAYFTRGGRYNQAHQPTVYCAEDALAVIAEAAFYECLEWQRKINYHRLNPVVYPLTSNHKLWCYSIDPPPAIIDLEHPEAIALFQHTPQMLSNLSYNPARSAHIPGQPRARDYFGTQELANEVRGHVPPPGSYPRPEGVKAPAIRVKRVPNYQAHMLALFVSPPPVHQPFELRSVKLLEFDLKIEFLQRSPRLPATSHTVDVDWCKPRFRLSGHGADVIPAYAARPRSKAYSRNRWYNLAIQFA